MPKVVAREGDLIIHTDGSNGRVRCINARNVLVGGKPIATENDVCSEHGGIIKSSVKNVFAGPNKQLVAVIGDTVYCSPSPGVIIIDPKVPIVGNERSVFVGGD